MRAHAFDSFFTRSNAKTRYAALAVERARCQRWLCSQTSVDGGTRAALLLWRQSRATPFLVGFFVPAQNVAQWCYRQPAEAPPLPPADNDDLTWLEQEMSRRNTPLHYDAAPLVDDAPLARDLSSDDADALVEQLGDDATTLRGDEPSLMFVLSAGRSGSVCRRLCFLLVDGNSFLSLARAFSKTRSASAPTSPAITRRRPALRVPPHLATQFAVRSTLTRRAPQRKCVDRLFCFFISLVVGELAQIVVWLSDGVTPSKSAPLSRSSNIRARRRRHLVFFVSHSPQLISPPPRLLCSILLLLLLLLDLSVCVSRTTAKRVPSLSSSGPTPSSARRCEPRSRRRSSSSLILFFPLLSFLLSPSRSCFNARSIDRSNSSCCAATWPVGPSLLSPVSSLTSLARPLRPATVRSMLTWQWFTGIDPPTYSPLAAASAADAALDEARCNNMIVRLLWITVFFVFKNMICCFLLSQYETSDEASFLKSVFCVVQSTSFQRTSASFSSSHRRCNVVPETYNDVAQHLNASSSPTDDDDARFDAIDRAIAHVFDVEARTHALVTAVCFLLLLSNLFIDSQSTRFVVVVAYFILQSVKRFDDRYDSTHCGATSSPTPATSSR